MTAIHIPRRTLTLPTGRVQVRWDSPLADRLILAAFNGQDFVSSVPIPAVEVGDEFSSSDLFGGYVPGLDVDEQTLIADVSMYENVNDYATVGSGFYSGSSDNRTFSVGLFAGSNEIYAACRRNNDSSTKLKFVDFPYSAVLAMAGSYSAGANVFENGNYIGAVPTQGSYVPDTRLRQFVFVSTSTSKRAKWVLQFSRILTPDEVFDVSANPGQLFRADPIRIYSLPSGPITLNSLTMSAFTSSGARATLGITR